MSPTATSSQPAPPLGIKIVCVLAAVGAAFGLLGSLVMLAAAPLLGVLALALTTAQAVTVYGLWHLRSWAWWAGLVVYGLGGLSHLADLNVVGFLVSALVVGYLLARRRLFR
ncbi:hypothetical protein OB920_20810 [Halobacteria archaeon HArc-gm2]|nr:hypothetical protein [Halobacteria archaeon HArc-gm2]